MDFVVWALAVYGVGFVTVLLMAFGTWKHYEFKEHQQMIPPNEQINFDVMEWEERRRGSDPLHEDDWLTWGTGENR